MKIKLSKKTAILLLLCLFTISFALVYFFLANRNDLNTPKTEKGEKITLEYPLPNTEVSCEFEVTGQVPNTWYTDGSFPLSILVNGEEVFKTLAFSEEDWKSDGLKSFNSTVVCKNGCVGSGEIVLSGNEDTFRIPVTFSTSCAASLEKSTVKVYYGNTKEDPDSSTCDTTYVLERTLPKTIGLGRSSLEIQLLQPMESEKEKGYFSSIPEDTKLESLRIADGVAYVELSSELIGEVEDECVKSRIRSQISNTMKGIEGVNDVKIYFNGNLF